MDHGAMTPLKMFPAVLTGVLRLAEDLANIVKAIETRGGCVCETIKVRGENYCWKVFFKLPQPQTGRSCPPKAGNQFFNQ